MAAEFHARQIGSHFGGHQQPFACQYVAAKTFAEKSTASGCHHNGICLHFPRLPCQTVDPTRPANPMFIMKKL
ncbi:hypothetical protein D3C78_1474770 [compost metagenome]